MFEIFTKNEAIWLLYILINYCFILLAFRLWGKNGLIAFVPISIIIANIQVNKLVVLFGMETTLGNIAYSSIFLISDLLTENYGKKEAKKIIGIGFLTLIFTTIVMYIAILINPSTNDIANIHISSIFTPFLRFTVASLTAYVISSFTDISIYQIIKKLRPSFSFIWLRNNFSTLISQIVDNLVFTTIAFIGVYDFKLILTIAVSTYILKVLTSVFDTPFVYIGTYLKNKGKINEL